MIVLLRSPQGGLYWSKARNSGGKRVAASDLAAVLCMHRYKSRGKLFREKRFPHQKRENKETIMTLHGRFWEQFALGKLVTYFPEKKGWRFLKPGSFLDFEGPFSCSPDMILDNTSLGQDILIGVETKCPFSAPIPKRKEDIKDENLLQCFTCLMTTGTDSWILAFYDTPTDTLTAYEIRPDWDLWRNTIVPRVEQFLSRVRDSSEATWTDPGKKAGLRKGKRETEEGMEIRERLLRVTFPLSLGPGPEDNSYQ